MHRILRGMVLLSSLMLMGWPTAAQDRSPLPKEVWAVREGQEGAVILRDFTRLTGRTLDHELQIRIFAEVGRAAAVMEDLPEGAFDVAGRTSYPDGREIRFHSKKDFAEWTVGLGSQTVRGRRVIPPGVTGDCVVEFSWSERADGPYLGLPFRMGRGLHATWVLQGGWPTRQRIIEISQPFPLAWKLDPGTLGPPRREEGAEFRRFTFANLPALDLPPHALASMAGLPRLTLFLQPDQLAEASAKGPEAYWREATELIYREEYESKLRRGKLYRALSEALRRDLPATPAEGASELLRRLSTQVVIAEEATPEERLAGQGKETPESGDLEAAARQRWASREGMRRLAVNLLGDAGFEVFIGKVPDRRVGIFDWNYLNAWQFDRDLIGVRDPSRGLVWFDPTLRFAEPGVVEAHFGGVPALVLNPRTWQVSRGAIGVLPPAAHESRYHLVWTLAETGASVAWEGQWKGLPALRERAGLWTQPPDRRLQRLRERCMAIDPKVQVGEVTWAGLDQVGSPFRLSFSAQVSEEESRKRRIQPFLGVPSPLMLAAVPPNRRVPIVLPYLQRVQASAEVVVPAGWSPTLPEALVRENPFGRVRWQITRSPGSSKVGIALDLEITTLSAAPDQAASLGEFLGWIEEALARPLVLEQAAD